MQLLMDAGGAGNSLQLQEPNLCDQQPFFSKAYLVSSHSQSWALVSAFQEEQLNQEWAVAETGTVCCERK